MAATRGKRPNPSGNIQPTAVTAELVGVDSPRLLDPNIDAEFLGDQVTIDGIHPNHPNLTHDPARMKGKELRAMRRVEALNLRIQGLGYREIAEILKEMGYKVGLKTAYYDVQDALTYLAKVERVRAEELRQLEVRRVDALWGFLWDGMSHGDVMAIAMGIKLMERRARMLGLDARPEEGSTLPTRPLRDTPTEALLERLDALRDRITRKMLTQGGNGNEGGG